MRIALGEHVATGFLFRNSWRAARCTLSGRLYATGRVSEFLTVSLACRKVRVCPWFLMSETWAASISILFLFNRVALGHEVVSWNTSHTCANIFCQSCQGCSRDLTNPQEPGLYFEFNLQFGMTERLGSAGIDAVRGLLAGNCMLPMKFSKQWPWESVWLVFSILSLLVLPWALALATIGKLFAVYSGLPFAAFLAPVLFGAGWGVAQILFGISVVRLGMALGYSIIVGLGPCSEP